MNILADIDQWDKFLSGQAGFILATLLYGIYHWKVIMPARAKETAELTRLADAVNSLVILHTANTDAKFDSLMEEVRKQK